MAGDLIPPPRPSAADPDRLEKVVGLIVAGATERQILSVIEKQWPGSDGTPLIVAAMLEIAETGEADPNVVKGWCIEATRAIYRKALGGPEADLDLALRAVAQMHRISQQK